MENIQGGYPLMMPAGTSMYFYLWFSSRSIPYSFTWLISSKWKSGGYLWNRDSYIPSKLIVLTTSRWSIWLVVAVRLVLVPGHRLYQVIVMNRTTLFHTISIG